MQTRILLAGLAALTFTSAASAALVLTASSTAGDHIYIRSPDTGSPFSAYNTVPAGATANIYHQSCIVINTIISNALVN